MNENKYPVSSGHLVIKEGAYRTNRYFIKDMESKKSGYANEDLKNLLILCDGIKNIKNIVNQLFQLYDVPKNDIRKKVIKSLKYFKRMGYIKFSKNPYPKDIVFHEKEMNYTLDVVQLDVTNACNLSCIHCYARAGKKLENELTTQQIFASIDRLADLGVLEIVITGGEPLVRKDIFKIMKYVKDKDMDFTLFTNGVLLNKNNIKKIKKLNPEIVAISVDSIKPEIHNKIRGQKCFRRTIENINLLLREKIRVRINTTLFRSLNDRQNEIESLIEFFIKKGVSQIVIGDFMDYGRGKKYKKYVPTASEAKKIVRAFKNKTKHIKSKNKLPVLKFSDMFKNKKTESLLQYPMCGIGTFMLTIKANGDIILCPVLDDKKYNAGNILKKDIKDIWLKSKVFKPFRSHSLNDIAKCKECPNKYECLGGCKARALMYNGKFNSPDLWMCSVYNVD